MKPRCIFILLSLLAFVACNDADDSANGEEGKPMEYTHTVFLYFPWSGRETSSSGSLASYISSNIKSIESAIMDEGGTGTTRVLMLRSSSISEGTLSEIAFADTACVEVELKSYSDWSYTSTDNLREMFNDVAAYSPTATYSMIVGGHGMGWLPKESRPSVARAFGGSDSATMTNINQLDSAIVESAVGHLTYLCFDDCYMANIETAYELRDAIDYLLASTCEIMSYGLPYREVWTYLKAATPSLTSVIDAFYSFYSTYTYPYGALSAIDCQYIDDAADLMQTLNARLDATGIAPSDISPQYLDGFTVHVFYDMEDYTTRSIEALGGDADLEQRFQNLYSNLVPAHCCTDRIYSDYINGTFLVETNCGATISDPTTNSQVTPYIEDTQWWAATH